MFIILVGLLLVLLLLVGFWYKNQEYNDVKFYHEPYSDLGLLIGILFGVYSTVD
jgi:uncharacterized integral membrane protein